KESEGIGGGMTVVEAFGTCSQMLPRDGFLHLHAGLEMPVGAEGSRPECFWRATVGKTIFQQRWNRAWSPMIEVVGSREHADGEKAAWDLVPQMQVSLSRL